jgi:hypothetical protein
MLNPVVGVKERAFPPWMYTVPASGASFVLLKSALPIILMQQLYPWAKLSSPRVVLDPKVGNL